ncbi:hypothetical protein [Pseudofrankia sp. DC12]|uniref:hypothetical protein n=1 Tax=Pseudofrankia sp. DC12 TaxID=683315 RepID=UPI0005F87683
MDLTPASAELVRAALTEALTPQAQKGLTGVSCIAAGADSIFADVALSLGGELEVILPASDYRARKVKPDHAELFDALISRAAHVRVMPFEESNRAAYEAANEALLGSVDLLMAVWDGRSPVDRGGTAAVVESARSRSLRVEIIWPSGAERLSDVKR